MLASDIFSRSDRLSSFLKFIVERALAGEGATLKELTIATELYGKGVDFTSSADPIVRVDARRLRDRLREYYATAPDSAVIITVPKGTYTPVFAAVASPVNRVTLPIPGARVARPRWWIGVALAAAAIFIATVVVTRWMTPDAGPARVLTVTSLPGAEEDPALSPDGIYVAFSWNGPSTVNGDIWVKSVDGDTMRQLTQTPDANEKYPAWSPDGQYVTFTRIAEGAWSVVMIPALGGSERIVALHYGDATWMPDARSLVMAGHRPDGISVLVRQDLLTGARRQLAEAPVGFSDAHPRVSADGETVAFERSGGGRSALFLVSTKGGEPRRLGKWTTGFIGGLTWSLDGRELIFPRAELSGRRLMRVAADGRQPESPIAGPPIGSFSPALARDASGRGPRLAFVSGQPDIGIRLVDLRGGRQGGVFADASAFCASTRVDVPGRLSPDDARVAFVSDRSGQQELWVAGRDESNLHAVTRFENATVSGGSWSPDGRELAFDVTIAGNTDIFTVRSDGGPATRLTDGPAIESDPDWSADGQSIYYASTETGRSEIWKIPARGGARIRLTSTGGFDPHESPDGQSVYFVDAPRSYGLEGHAAIARVSTHGGQTSAVYGGVMPGAWTVAGSGILFITGHGAANAPGERDALALYDLATGRLEHLGDFPFRVGPYGVNRFLTASKDGHWALAARVERWERDIFVLENFR